MAVRLQQGDLEDDEDINFDTIAARLHDYIVNDELDKDVQLYYSNIQRNNMLIPIQTAYLAAAYQVALSEAYVFKRQHHREALAKGQIAKTKFGGHVKLWVLEVQNLDIKTALPNLETEQRSPSLAVRISVEGAAKLTTRGTPSRNFDGTFEAMRINQDLDFLLKRPTSMLHIDLVHMNDDVPADSLERDVLVGHIVLPLRKLESQKMMRQLYPIMREGHCVAEIKLRMQYTYKEQHMLAWDQEAGGMPRSPEQGGSAFTMGVIGVGQIGRRVLDNLLRCGSFQASQIHVSTRGPERLASYEKLGVVCCYDDGAVAQRADMLVIACLPAHMQQVAKALRGNVRSTTLIMSIVAGYSTDRMASLLRVSPGQLLKPLLGGESGLPLPDHPAQPAAQPARQPAPGRSGALANPVSRAEVALERRRAADLLKQHHLRAHVMTAFRASLADEAVRQQYVQAIASALRPLDMPERPLMTTARASLTGEVPELQIWGEHRAQPELRQGQRVLVLPGGADLDTREGFVHLRIDDARQEYLVRIGDMQHRFKRSRLVNYQGHVSPSEDGGLASTLALAAGGNSADTAEEGFMVDDPGVAQEDAEVSADLGQVEAFFKMIGERAVGAREEPVAIMSEKSGGFDAKKKKIKAEASKPMYIAPEV